MTNGWTVPKHAAARLLAPWRRLWRDRRGASAVFLAAAIIPMIAFIGIGTDTARAVLVKSRLSSALDSAGLAGGWSFFMPTRDQDITMYFNANYPPNYMGSTVNGPDISVDPEAETITLTAEATIKTAFMHLFGKDQITVGAMAEITREVQAIDVVLAVDMSSSMSWSAGSTSRISAARTAALELVNILFGDNAEKELLHIGLVPWNSKVNIMVAGQTFDSDLTTTQGVPAFTNPETGANQSEVYYANNSPVPLLSEPPSNWDGCVFNRYLDDGIDNNDADIELGAMTLNGTDWVAWQPILPGTEPQFGGEPVWGWNVCSMSLDGGECARCLSHGITPLNNTKAGITTAIQALQHPDGTTNIPQGLGWAWRVLKPDAPFTEAIPNPDYERMQAIVLLTDGENWAGNGDGYKGTFGLGGTGQADMNARLLALADNIKGDGVILYVIQFANNGTALQTLLKQVASGPESPYYHYAPDADTLSTVFHEVANHLSALRLSK